MVADRAAHPGAARPAPVSSCLRGGGSRPRSWVLCPRHRAGVPRRLGEHVSRAGAGTQRREACCTVRPRSVTGIALPGSAAEVAALHWRGGAGGGPAAPWIHLMSATAILFVVIPRLLLGAFAGVSAWRLSRTVPLPESALPYVRRLLAASDAALPAATIQVIPYAYQPASASLRGAELLLRAVFGTDARIEFAQHVRVWRRGLTAAKTRGGRIAGLAAESRGNSRSREPRYGARVRSASTPRVRQRPRDCWCWWTKRHSCNACGGTARCSTASTSAGKHGATLSPRMVSRRARSTLLRWRRGDAAVPTAEVDSARAAITSVGA